MSELFILGSSPVIPHERLDGSSSLNHPDILSGELLVPTLSRDGGICPNFLYWVRHQLFLTSDWMVVRRSTIPTFCRESYLSRP